MPFPDEATRYPDRSDGWYAYRTQFADLFSVICREGVENVVFLCGDSHLFMDTEIRLPAVNGKPLKARCIMASPMYAPYPFANGRPEEYLRTGRLELPGLGFMEYEVTECREGDSCALVEVKRENGEWRIEAEVVPQRQPCTQRLAEEPPGPAAASVAATELRV